MHLKSEGGWLRTGIPVQRSWRHYFGLLSSAATTLTIICEFVLELLKTCKNHILFYRLTVNCSML
jgi:hypothetical protein